MDKGKKHHSLVVSSIIAISITMFISAQPTYASGLTIYSPYWMDYQKEIGTPYFKYCGIFDSCFKNEIRIFSFLPLTTSQQDVEVDEDTSARNNVASILPPKKIVTSIIPFELPFP